MGSEPIALQFAICILLHFILLHLLNQLLIAVYDSITWRIGLPILQFFPVYPGTQLQLKSFTASLQLPPFSHGPSAQSSIS